MKLDRITLRQLDLPSVKPYRTSGWSVSGSSAIIVEVEADGLVGWGESAVLPGPWYTEETCNTVWAVVQDHLAPLLLDCDLQEPHEVDRLFAPMRGNRLAKAGLEFAVWDLFGRRSGQSLAALLGGTQPTIDVGVGVGIYNDIDTLLQVVADFLEVGYARIKLKICPGWDLEPTRAVRHAWPDLKLQVDANSVYTLDDADHLAKFDDLELLLIEQPLAYDDIFDHAKLQAKLETPICLDESIVSPDHARWAIEMRATQIINIKAGRVGGLSASLKIHDIAQAAGIPVWHGGMMETGIGRAINVAIASLPNFTLPGDISSNDRNFARDIVHNPFTLNADSTLTVPTAPGHGAEVDESYLEAVTVRKVEIRR